MSAAGASGSAAANASALGGSREDWSGLYPGGIGNSHDRAGGGDAQESSGIPGAAVAGDGNLFRNPVYKRFVNQLFIWPNDLNIQETATGPSFPPSRETDPEIIVSPLSLTTSGSETWIPGPETDTGLTRPSLPKSTRLALTAKLDFMSSTLEEISEQPVVTLLTAIKSPRTLIAADRRPVLLNFPSSLAPSWPPFPYEA